jgi:hypothetical protein
MQPSNQSCGGSDEYTNAVESAVGHVDLYDEDGGVDEV